MKPLEIAARFAAFTWYTSNRDASTRTTQAEARRFSQENWETFVPVAHEGLGRLLLKVAKPKSNGQRHTETAIQRTKPWSNVMFHTIAFSADRTVDLEVSPSRPLERLRIRKGTVLDAEIKPHVVETPTGPIEVADLFFSDGSTARSVPFELFSFVN